MAQLIRIDDNRGGYLTLVEYVRNHGRKQESRNGPTLEVDDMVIQLADPTKSIPSGIGRRGYSLALALLEGLQLVAGQTYDDLMVKVAPATEQFTEPNGKFHGGYGRRIGPQMRTIVERLKADHESRQCVVMVWDSELDTLDGKRDYPCTCLFNWRIREGKLLMSTFMRSQDVHWGWPYDAVMFTTLQLTMADYLGVEPGPYTHHAASFHIYTKDLPDLVSMRPWDGVDTRLRPFETHDSPWSQVQATADDILQALERSGDYTDDQLPSEGTAQRWFYETIKAKLNP